MDYKKIILDLSRTQDERIQAAFKLENIADDNSIKAIGQALLNDPSPIVRHECAFSLGETAAAREAGPYLIKAIEEDQNIFVVHEAILALGTLGDRRFIPFIKKFLKDSRAEISESAEIALQRIRT